MQARLDTVLTCEEIVERLIDGVMRDLGADLGEVNVGSPILVWVQDSRNGEGGGEER